MCLNEISRQVYSTILQEHLNSSETDTQDILFREFATLPVFKIPTSVKTNSIPSRFELRQNYPNPFNPYTSIEYAIPEANHVKIEVYTTLGKRVKKLVDDFHYPGNYKATFDGRYLASGSYIYTMRAGSYKATRKMILMK